ncbi:hypothetical protein [Cellulosimicrobium cellulans]|uniref:SinR family protein n=1 Tax=Cellulosimicrobium cellulans TaxID=1710 RepID=A0A4Y4E3C4_CELCE|nr:hypothetical protein [Cellulosimicrobium cellulans]GED09171.1 hypothetical protein CCE02nite_11700 [Cellulosimicrobium cellulans]
MTAILVTYDLNTPGQDYSTLHKAIKEAGSSWWHYLDSTWIVSGYGLTAADVSAALLPHMDKNDNLLVLNISGDTYSGWLSQDAWDWIKKSV